MRLRYSTSLVATIIFSHLILTTRHLASSESTDTSSEDPYIDDGEELVDELPNEEQRLALIEFAKKQVLKILDLKAPPKNNRKTLYLPRDVLRDYAEDREKVRNIIPDDRDFYGKINPEEIEKLDTKLESLGRNEESYDIEVVMGPAQHGSDSDGTYKFKGESTNLIRIGTDDPQDVPPELEHSLPPHTVTGHYPGGQRFTSVHLKFNISNQIAKPASPEELKGAELRLTRDRVIPSDLSCRIGSSSIDSSDVPKIFSMTHTKDNMGDSNTSLDTTERKAQSEDRKHHDNSKPTKPCVFHHRSRFQRLFVLDITVFDVRDIMKRWLRYPARNYGLIIRVKDEVEGLVQSSRTERSSNFEGTTTNDSTQMASETQSEQIGHVDRISIEHLRLKRETLNDGQSERSWLEDRPAIVMYTSPIEVSRRTRRNPQESTSTNTAPEPSSESTTSASSESSLLVSGTTIQPNTQDDDNLSSNNGNNGSKKVTGSPNNPLTPSSPSPNTSGARQRTSRRIQASSQSGRGASGSRNPGARPRPRPRAQNRDCSLKEFKLDFDEVGWSDWIIAPRAYNMNYCSGECQYPIAENQNATNHAIIQSIFHSVGRLVPKACCSATKLGEVTLLYQVEDAVSMRRYDGMIASACACL